MSSMEEMQRMMVWGELTVAGIKESNPRVNVYDWWRQIEMGQLNQGREEGSDRNKSELHPDCGNMFRR